MTISSVGNGKQKHFAFNKKITQKTEEMKNDNYIRGKISFLFATERWDFHSLFGLPLWDLEITVN